MSNHPAVQLAQAKSMSFIKNHARSGASKGDVKLSIPTQYVSTRAISAVPAWLKKGRWPLFVSEIMTNDRMKFQKGHIRSAALLGPTRAGRHFVGACGEEIGVTQVVEVCKCKAGSEPAELWTAVLTLWVLAPACLDTCGRDRYEQQSCLLHYEDGWCVVPQAQRLQFTRHQGAVEI